MSQSRIVVLVLPVLSLLFALVVVAGFFALASRLGALTTLLAQAGSAACVLLILRVAQADKASFFLGVCLMHSL